MRFSSCPYIADVDLVSEMSSTRARVRIDALWSDMQPAIWAFQSVLAVCNIPPEHSLVRRHVILHQTRVVDVIFHTVCCFWTRDHGRDTSRATSLGADRSVTVTVCRHPRRSS